MKLSNTPQIDLESMALLKYNTVDIREGLDQ